MNIAEKLTTIAENTQAVHEAGKQAEYDAIWDCIQDNGNRTQYNSAFLGWNWEYADPKYKIDLTGITNSNPIFGGSTTLKRINPEKFDFSNALKVNYLFSGCSALEEIPLIVGGEQFLQCFKNCTKLKRIRGLKYINLAQNNHTQMFQGCENLEIIDEISGEFGGQGFNVQWCPLNHATLLRILNSLADKSTDTSGTTWSITLGADNIAKLTEDELDIGRNKGWVIA